MKKIITIFSLLCVFSLCLFNNKPVNAVEPRAGIEYNTTTTKKYFHSSLGYATFTSVMQYNNNTSTSTLYSTSYKGYPKYSGYKFTSNKAKVSYSGGKIIVKWQWSLRDSKGNLVDSGTETHTH